MAFVKCNGSSGQIELHITSVVTDWLIKTFCNSGYTESLKDPYL